MRDSTSLPILRQSVAFGNYNNSRQGVSLVVIHTIVGSISSATARFNNSSQKVSAHYGIGLDGRIYQWVSENSTAYHAGNYVINQRSIGIEHEDGGRPHGTRTDELYASSAQLVKDICNYYGIPMDRQHVIRHNEVPDVQTGCPDSLDIDRILREAHESSSPNSNPQTLPSDSYNVPENGEQSNIPFSDDYHPYNNTSPDENKAPILETFSAPTDNQQAISPSIVTRFLNFLKPFLIFIRRPL